MSVSSLTVRSKVIVVFASVHLVFLLCGALPERWRDWGHLSQVFSFYERLTNCRQVWNMFETIPNMYRLEARLVVKQGTQKLHEEGMVLPGLRKFIQQDQVRVNNWMVTVIFNPTRGVFRESYLRHAAAALLRSGRYDPTAEVTLEVIPAYTRSLLGVRTLKEIAVERPLVLGPFKLGALVAGNTASPPLP